VEHRTDVVKLESPLSPDAKCLMDELSERLYTITGDSGRSHFSPFDVTGTGAAFAVARDKFGKVIGCGAILPMSGETAELKRMYAKRGSGFMILIFLEREAKRLGYNRLILATRLVNERAVSFYQRYGYAIIENYGVYTGKPATVLKSRFFKKTGCKYKTKRRPSELAQ